MNDKNAEFEPDIDYEFVTNFIAHFSHTTPEAVLDLPITEYRRKQKYALRIGAFLSGNGIDFNCEEGSESKYEKEYQYLKEIGYLNGKETNV